MPYYAIRKGKETGIFNDWNEVKDKVIGFKGAEYRKFKDEEEAVTYLNYGTSTLDKKELKDLKEGEVVAYTDGSFNSQDNSYSYGGVLVNSEGEQITFNGRDNHPTLLKSRNVAGELLGATVAVSKAIEEGYKKVYLHYDYAGIRNWVKKDWKVKNKVAEMYTESMEHLMKYIDIEFIKVKAHSGVKYNELADRLAGSAE